MMTFNSNGSFTYVPNPDFNGVDSFTYSISGDYAFMFEISDQGVLVLSDNYYLDYELIGESMTLSVTATDLSGLSITRDITIEVADLQYATPEAPEVVSNYVITPT